MIPNQRASLPAGLGRLRALPAAKAEIALRAALAGGVPTAQLLRARGFELSPQECAQLGAWSHAPFTSGVCSVVGAADGTERLVIGLADGETVETVVMPNGAVCVSSQVGCAVGCRFCASGRQGLRRNLQADEIVEQVVHARRRRRIDRVVFMGMGEPGHNLRAVLDAVVQLRVFGGISPRKQTLSTVGGSRVFAALREAEVKPCLAWSLHSTDPALRARLLPRAPAEPLAAQALAADRYARSSGTPVQVEWTVLRGVNDSPAEIDGLCALLEGVRGYVNFIPWNPVEGLAFERPDRDHVVEMVRTLRRRGVLATVRASAGGDADAACGQLRLRHVQREDQRCASMRSQT